MFFIFWVIVILIIVAIAKKEKESQEKAQQEYAKKFTSTHSSVPKDSSNSYYSKAKVEQYKKMNQNHLDHDDSTESKTIDERIGYKRCPKCNTLVSKTANSCFMCDYFFEKEENQPEQ